MSYVVPQVLVFQEFETVPTAITDPLRAHISGPNGVLHRYSDPDEKSQIGLGEYDPLTDTNYEFPERSAGGAIDAASVRIFFDDAKLKYFENLVTDPGTITVVANRPNKIEASVDVFKEGAGFNRSALLYDRDAQVNDLVWIRGVSPDDDETYEQWSYVRSIEQSLTDPVVGEAYADEINQASTSADIEVDFTGTDQNCVALTADGGAYDGRQDGNVTEVYTITVTESSTGGDHTTAELRVISDSGNDNDLSVTPAAVGDPFAIGSRGLEITFSLGAGSSCSSDSPETANDLIAGQEWTITVTQDFEEGKAYSGGDYSGEQDTTYLIEVTRGGEFEAVSVGDRPQITVTTVDGYDVSGPHTLVSANTLYTIGTYGVKVGFFGTGSNSSSSSGSLVSRDPIDGLRKGDKFYIPVTAAAGGKYNILVLGHSVRSEIREAEDLDLRLYIQKDVEIPSQRATDPGEYNWQLEGATEVRIMDSISVYDSSWTDDGEALPLEVESATMYAEYREWVSALCTSVEAIDDVGNIDDIPGQLDPANPLKFAVSKALANSNGTLVKYTAVCDPDDLESWQDVLSLLVGRDDVYNLVPLTRTKAVLDLYQAHINTQSSPTKGRWRAAFFNLSVDEISVVVDATTTSDEEVALATISDDPTTSTTVYRWLEVPADNAKFITNGVQSGDVVRTFYTSDGFGGVTYTEFTVDEVISEDTIRLTTGHSVPVGVAIKIEIWHPNTKSEMATQIATSAGAWGDSRICAVWPDEISSGGVTFEGYHLCAALAGLRSGVVPHQPLTNVEIAGFDDVTRTKDFFNSDQLDTMADSGTWIVTQTEDGTVITRHALTTDTSGILAKQEESIRTNVDSISYYFLGLLKPYIGRVNVTDGTIRRIRANLGAGIDFLISAGYTETLGGQLLDGTSIVRVDRHATMQDRIVAVLDLVVPYPLNNIELYLVV